MAKAGRPKKNENINENNIQEFSNKIPDNEGESSPLVVDEISDNSELTESLAPNFYNVSESPKAAHTWEPISSVPRNGTLVKLTRDPSEPGVLCYWRKSRAFANATHRWEETGFWTEVQTGKNIAFTPLWWKHRHTA